MQDSHVYEPRYTTDGIDPDQQAGQLMVPLVQQLIQASHAGGAR
jgi:hypothetical protein